MRGHFVGIALAAALLCTAPASRADGSDSLTFTLIPPDVSGPAGTTIGWGFTITNTSTSTDYLDISGIDSDLFSATDGTPDASIFAFPNLAPGQSVTQMYDPADGLGLFQFTWNDDLAVGTTETGQFRLYGAFCDPAVDQFCAEDDSVPSALLATADYTATVTAAAGTPIAEPPSLLLLICGICAFSFLGPQRKSSIGSRWC